VAKGKLPSRRRGGGARIQAKAATRLKLSTGEGRVKQARKAQGKHTQNFWGKRRNTRRPPPAK